MRVVVDVVCGDHLPFMRLFIPLLDVARRCTPPVISPPSRTDSTAATSTAVHKLLENTLYECELYLGHALMFGDAEVRRAAEQNLDGCYQKRLLGECARMLAPTPRNGSLHTRLPATSSPASVRCQSNFNASRRRIWHQFISSRAVLLRSGSFHVDGRMRAAHDG